MVFDRIIIIILKKRNMRIVFSPGDGDYVYLRRWYLPVITDCVKIQNITVFTAMRTSDPNVYIL